MEVLVLVAVLGTLLAVVAPSRAVPVDSPADMAQRTAAARLRAVASVRPVTFHQARGQWLISVTAFADGRVLVDSVERREPAR